jgi:hypothetical protein
MAEPPVVCNTSPLIKLAGVGLLDLMPRFYGAIWLPEVIRDEYLARVDATSPDIRALPWLSMHPVTIEPALQALSGFGVGEAVVISLAVACGARLVLLDDKRARRVASERGLVLVGTLGMLVRARQQGYLAAVRPVLDTMIAQGRYISPALRAQTLQAVGESEDEDTQ